MTVIVTEQTKALFPPSIRKRMGIKAGTKLEVRVDGGVVSFVPAVPDAKLDDEYTKEQRRKIDAELAEARKGPFHGPFKSGQEIAAFLKSPPAKAL